MSQIIPLFKRIEKNTKQSTFGGRSEKFFEFSFGKKQFVIPAVDITEIVIPSTIVKIDKASYIAGVMNIRGAVIPIINIRDRINLSTESETTGQSRIVVMSIKQKHHLGFIVDSIETRLKDGITEQIPEKQLEDEKVFTYAVIENQKYPILFIDTWLEPDEFKTLEQITSDYSLNNK